MYQYESDYYEEVPSEDEEVAAEPPVINDEPVEMDIPAPEAESPESPAASPSPVPSEASGQMRVGIEIPLDEDMVAPPSPAPVVDYNSDDEAFGAENLRIYSFLPVYLPVAFGIRGVARCHSPI